MISERILIVSSRFVKHKTKIKLNPSNLFISRVRCSKKKNEETSRVRSRESQKKAKRALSNKRKACSMCYELMHITHKVAKLRTNTLITGSTICGAGNELFRFFFKLSRARRAHRFSFPKENRVLYEWKAPCSGARRQMLALPRVVRVFLRFVCSKRRDWREKKTFYNINRKTKKNKNNTTVRANSRTKQTHTHKQTNAFFSSSICRSSPRAALRFDPGTTTTSTRRGHFDTSNGENIRVMLETTTVTKVDVPRALWNERAIFQRTDRLRTQSYREYPWTN